MGKYTFFNTLFMVTKFKKASRQTSVRLFPESTRALTLDLTRKFNKIFNC